MRKTAKLRAKRVPETDTAWLGGEAFLGGGVAPGSPDPPTHDSARVQPPSATRLPSWISIALRWIRRHPTP